jgi:hypothetical protein
LSPNVRQENHDERLHTPQEDPDLDDILAALKEALDENSQLVDMPEEEEEEVARQLVLGGHLEGEPSPPLVAEA